MWTSAELVRSRATHVLLAWTFPDHTGAIVDQVTSAMERLFVQVKFALNFLFEIWRCWNPHSRLKTISRNNLPVPPRVHKVRTTAVKDLEADVSSVSPLSQGTGWGLTHETSVVQIFYGVTSSIITSFDKTKFSRFILQPTQHLDFLRIYYFIYFFGNLSS